MKKKLVIRIATIVVAMCMVMTMTACSTSDGNGNGISIDPVRQTFEVSNASQWGKDFTITIGDELTNIGIMNGSSVRVRFYSGYVTLWFDLRVELTQWSKDQIVDSLTELLKNYIGDSAKDVAVSSTEFFSNESRLKFSVTFNLAS